MSINELIWGMITFLHVANSSKAKQLNLNIKHQDLKA